MLIDMLLLFSLLHMPDEFFCDCAFPAPLKCTVAKFQYFIEGCNNLSITSHIYISHLTGKAVSGHKGTEVHTSLRSLIRLGYSPTQYLDLEDFIQ